MDILWPAMGISIIVGFVLYVLAGHWSRVLRKQSWTIRRLSDRLQILEEVDDPHFRERLSDTAPMPLEQVFTFSFRCNDAFWRGTLGLADAEWQFVRAFGSFLGSVKLDRWRSHMVATITEVLPNRKTAAWQTRALDYYPGSSGRGEAMTLWDLPLAPIRGGERPPSLELALHGDALELAAHDVSGGEMLFFRVPLDPMLLAEFRSHDPAAPVAGNGSANGHGPGDGTQGWQEFYFWQDEALGLEWQMRVRDLTRKAEWDRWKVLHTAAVRIASGS
jgi:hypothetical protein